MVKKQARITHEHSKLVTIGARLSKLEAKRSANLDVIYEWPGCVPSSFVLSHAELRLELITEARRPQPPPQHPPPDSSKARLLEHLGALYGLQDAPDIRFPCTQPR